MIGYSMFEHFTGWPAFHQSTVHSTPLLYDIDKDGVREIALATYNGEVLFFRLLLFMLDASLSCEITIILTLLILFC